MQNVPNLAVVSIFKDEAPYLDEWLQFHRAQGVAHFYLYNNGSTDDYIQSLEAHREYVTLIDWAIPFAEKGQQRSIAHAIHTFGERHDWLGVFDIDEFLFSPGRLIPEALSLVHDADLILVNTIFYGTSGLDRVPAGKLLETLVHRSPLTWSRNRQRKSIFRASVVVGLEPYLAPTGVGYEGGSLLIHEPLVRDTARVVNGDGVATISLQNRVSRAQEGEHVQQPIVRRALRRVKSWLMKSIKRSPQLQYIAARWLWRWVPLWDTSIASYGGVSLFRINHYGIRTASEFRDKQRRFRGTHLQHRYSEAYFRYHDRNEVFDPVLSGNRRTIDSRP